MRRTRCLKVGFLRELFRLPGFDVMPLVQPHSSPASFPGMILMYILEKDGLTLSSLSF